MFRRGEELCPLFLLEAEGEGLAEHAAGGGGEKAAPLVVAAAAALVHRLIFCPARIAELGAQREGEPDNRKACITLNTEITEYRT